MHANTRSSEIPIIVFTLMQPLRSIIVYRVEINLIVKDIETHNSHMDPYYLTDTLYLHNDTMYDNLHKPLTRANWHHKSKSYGWNKLPRPWIIHLNTMSENPPKNSQFGVLDCPEDGDCFFHCIANALTERDGYETIHEAQDIRQMLCDALTSEQYQCLISIYRCMKEVGDFQEQWNPDDIHDIEDFKRVVLRGGHSYWGDHLLLQIICDILKITLTILTYKGPEYKSYTEPVISVYPLLMEDNPGHAQVILLLVNECHFQLVGHFNGHRLTSYFRDGIIPREIVNCASLTL